jgi:cell wall-associated NlpC family hydrolase
MDIDRFIQALRAQEGAPFHHQGRTAAGVDCAGLVLAALAEQGITLDVPADYARSAAGARLPAELERCALLRQRPAHEFTQPGDLLLFSIRRQAQHLAVALEPGRMIHATPTQGVREVTLSPLWSARLVAQYGWCHG